jgi:UDPglucose 6-dehydrogenase
MADLWVVSGTTQGFDPAPAATTQRIFGSRSALKLMGTKEVSLAGAGALLICAG